MKMNPPPTPTLRCTNNLYYCVGGRAMGLAPLGLIMIIFY